MIAAAPPKRRHLALILDHLGVGGVQKMTLALGRELVARGYCVDLVVCDTAGPLARRLPDGIRLFGLERSNSVTTRLVALRSDPGGLGDLLRPVLLAPVLPAKMLYTAGLASYLRQRKPQGLIAATRILNIIAVWAARLARASLPIVLSERNPPSAKINGSSWWHQRQLPQLMARTYRFAEAIVAVSDSVADDLAALTGLPRSHITTIYNPVVGSDLAGQARAPCDHPWFAPGQPPVILGAGRLVEQKDFPTLIRAFARLRRQRLVRLVILGAGKNDVTTENARAALVQLAAAHGVSDDVALPGFTSNPFAFMARAAVFVLSSRYEGLPTVLIEALACGCPVVSTDCPGGSHEILENGRFGELVPVGDESAMAEAILRALDHPPDRERLIMRGRTFNVAAAADAYLSALWGAVDHVRMRPRQATSSLLVARRQEQPSSQS
jgi:glycosyltransferase involved in cell wall biosynthesis